MTFQGYVKKSAEAADRPEGIPPETAEIVPAKRSKRPFLFAGLAAAAVICILAAVVMLLRPHAQSPDLLAGTSWRSGDDASQWVFHEDQTFHWYQTKGKTDDNYFAGTYEFHIGQDAMDYLTTELSEYGMTELMIQLFISMRQEYTRDNFVCFSTTNQSFMLNGQEQLSEEVVSSYFGFLLSDGTYLDITNMTTGTYYGFTKE